MEAQALKPHVITRMILAQFIEDCTTIDAVKALKESTGLTNAAVRELIQDARKLGLIYQPGRAQVYKITKAGMKFLEVV